MTPAQLNCMDETGISLDAALPLSWTYELDPSLSQSEEHLQSNISLLKALSAIESAHDREQDIPENTRKALERLESKLDVLLLLVARLTDENAPQPPRRQIFLSRDHVVWQEPVQEKPALGRSVCIKLSLSPRIPQPLVLHGKISALDETDSGHRIRVDFEVVDAELLDWFDRTIFRYHRRAVHAQRQS